MPFQFRLCELEMDHAPYVTFLIGHHAKLNLPYPFATKLSFISSPLMLGKAMIVIDEDAHRIVAAAGFVYGTGGNDYEDRHVCQFEVAFIEEPYRRTGLFKQGIQAVADAIHADNPEVAVVQFWAPSDNGELTRLFSKLTVLPGGHRSEAGGLVFYKLPFDQFQSYVWRL